MLIRQGFQYALRLNGQREAILRRWVGCRRYIYNEALAYQKAEIAAGRKRPGYAALCARLPGLKAEHPWLAEPPAQALQQALKDLCKAWDAKYQSSFGTPRFKKRGESDTLRLPQACEYDATAGAVRLPKLGVVRLRHSRRAEGKLKNVTVRMEGRRWIVSLQTERELEVGTPRSVATVGLDFGVATTITPSSGAPIRLPAKIGRYERRMRRLQQAVSHKECGSANRKKAVAKLNACHRRIASIRRDFLHQNTTKLVRENALIAIEDLQVRSMTCSAAGTVDAPGRNVRAKAGLNRSILRNGWSLARSMLEYKATMSGVTLVAVSPAFTSQQCHSCGHTAAENRRGQARFACVACGHAENADRNAARNILAKAQRMLADASQEAQPGGRPASTAGYAGTNACEAGVQRRTRPRSAAQGGSQHSVIGVAAEPPMAGTVLELSPSRSLHAQRYAKHNAWGGEDVNTAATGS